MRPVQCRAVALFAASVFSLSAAAKDKQQPPVKDPKLQHETLIPHREIFRRSISDVSGDIFLLTQPYSYLLDDTDFKPGAPVYSSHISTRHDGKVDIVVPPHAITMHGYAWDYDLRIPLAFYDPSGKWFKPGTYKDIAVQQDIAPTLADVLGVAAPDRAAGRILKEARRPATSERPRIVAVLVQDQMGLQYFAAHPNRAKFIRSLFQKGAYFQNAQVADVDVETSVGHAAIGTGGYPRDHHISGNSYYHPGLWAVKPVYAAQLTDTLASEAYPLLLDAATLADVWTRTRGGKPEIFSLVSAARASLSLGGHGSMFEGGKKNAVVYLEDHGPQSGSYVANESFYTLPAAAKGKNLKTYAEALQKERDGAWWGNKLIRDDGQLDLAVARSTPALVRMEQDIVDQTLDAMHFGADDETDLLFLNFKASDYCGHLFGYESEECGEVLDAVDQALQQVVAKLDKLSGGSFVLAYTADHGAAPIPELSGGVRYDRMKIVADMNARFDRLDNHVDAVLAMSSSQVWVNRRELALNGFTVADVVKFLQNYSVPLAAPWNMQADKWLAKGHPARQKLFFDVVSRDDIEAARKLTGH